jgi:hypothetical protein
LAHNIKELEDSWEHHDEDDHEGDDTEEDDINHPGPHHGTHAARTLAFHANRIARKLLYTAEVECPTSSMHTDDVHHEQHNDDDWDCMYHAQFMHDLDILYIWSCVTLAFTVVVTLTVMYTVLKHLSIVPAHASWNSDLYDRNVIEEVARAIEAERNDNKFLERNLEMPHGRLSIAGSPPMHRPSMGGGPPMPMHRPTMGGGMMPPPPMYAGSPMHPEERRISMQQAMNAQAFGHRPSLDGRRSSLGMPVDRRPSFDGRPPGRPY